MPRINLVQAINIVDFKVEDDGKGGERRIPVTISLTRGINEVSPEILRHPYIVAHLKAGSASIVPDPMDPEDIAELAEREARRARAEADAAKALKDKRRLEEDEAIRKAGEAALHGAGAALVPPVQSGAVESAEADADATQTDNAGEHGDDTSAAS